MYSIDLSKNNNVKEIQTGNTCTIASILNCIENKLNFLNIPRDLDDIKTAEDISLAMGFDANKILMSGANTLLVLEELTKTPVHNSSIKICNLKSRSRISKDKLQFVFDNLKAGRTLVASMFGSSTTINSKGYATWNYNGSSHAMHLPQIKTEKDYLGFDNTIFMKEVVRCDFETFEKSCHGLFAFDISINGVVQNTNPSEPVNIANDINSKYDYYAIMKKEVPESERNFNKYEDETKLWKNIKSLIEINTYRQSKKKTVKIDVKATDREISHLDKDFQKKVRAFLKECPYIFITEGYRPQARQDYLYSLGRTRKGSKVTWTLKSNHTLGKAVDIAFHGGELYPKDNKKWFEVSEIAKKHGIDWGFNLWERDKPHFQDTNL